MMHSGKLAGTAKSTPDFPFAVWSILEHKGVTMTRGSGPLQGGPWLAAVVCGLWLCGFCLELNKQPNPLLCLFLFRAGN